MTTNTYRRMLALIVSWLALGTFLTAATAQSPEAAPGTAPVLTRPLPTEPDDYDVLAATGDWIWAELPSDRADESSSLSKDGGRTWTHHIGMPSEGGWFRAGAGRLAYFSTDEDGISGPGYFYPNRLDSGGWGEFWTIMTMGTKAALSTGLNLDRAGQSQIKATFAALPKKLAKPTHTYAFTADSAYLVRITTTAGSADYASVFDVAGGHPLGRITLPRTSQHQVSGSALYSLTGTKTGLNLCRQPLPSGGATCSTVVGGDQRKASATLYQFGANAIVRPSSSTAPLLVAADGTVTPVRLPAGTATWARDGKGDPSLPLLRTVDAGGVPHHLRVQLDGSTTEYLAVKPVTMELWSLALAPNALFSTSRGSDGWVAKRWTLGATSLGEPQPSLQVLQVSGSRWVVDDEQNRRFVYDAGRRGMQIRGGLLSGPYLLQDDELSLVTGRRIATKRALGMFGSLLAERVPAPKGKSGYWVALRDLAAGSAQSAPIKVNAKASIFTGVSMWGDWLGLMPTANRSRVMNRRTGQVLDRSGDLIYLGDGFAVLSSDTKGLSVWVFATNTTVSLGSRSRWDNVDATGDRVAYSDGKRVIIRTIAGVGGSRSRLLGALTSGKATKKSPWKAALDLTKPLAAGTLVIRDAKGRVVRTLATAASDTGSLRGISWSGRDTAGRQLKGHFTWELVAAATDGSGYAVAVTGDGAARGTITVG